MYLLFFNVIAWTLLWSEPVGLSWGRPVWIVFTWPSLFSHHPEGQQSEMSVSGSVCSCTVLQGLSHPFLSNFHELQLSLIFFLNFQIHGSPPLSTLCLLLMLLRFLLSTFQVTGILSPPTHPRLCDSFPLSFPCLWKEHYSSEAQAEDTEFVTSSGGDGGTI